MMPGRIPAHPTENPRLDDDTFAATIVRAVEGRYGQDEPFVQILFWLAGQEVYFVTNFYFPKGGSWKVQRRFWVLCKIIGLEPHDLASGGQFSNRNFTPQVQCDATAIGAYRHRQTGIGMRQGNDENILFFNHRIDDPQFAELPNRVECVKHPSGRCQPTSIPAESDAS